MYEKPINDEHEIVKKNLYLCTTFFKVRRNKGCNRYTDDYPVYSGNHRLLSE